MTDFLLGIGVGLTLGANAVFYIYRKEIRGSKSTHQLRINISANTDQFIREVKGAQKAVEQLKKDAGI